MLGLMGMKAVIVVAVPGPPPAPPPARCPAVDLVFTAIPGQSPDTLAARFGEQGFLETVAQSFGAALGSTFGASEPIPVVASFRGSPNYTAAVAALTDKVASRDGGGCGWDAGRMGVDVVGTPVGWGWM